MSDEKLLAERSRAGKINEHPLYGDGLKILAYPNLSRLEAGA